MKLNPYLNSHVDIVETVLTFVLLLLSGCGLVFAVSRGSDHQSESLLEWQVEMLTWLTYLGMVFGSLLAAVLTANDCFQVGYFWYLDRVHFLGDASADPSYKGELTFSIGVRAHVRRPDGALSRNASSPKDRPKLGLGTLVLGRLPQRLSSLTADDDSSDDEPVGSNDAKLFHLANLLHCRMFLKRLAASEKESCAPHAQRRVERPLCSNLQWLGCV